jgi:hypothetical protein
MTAAIPVLTAALAVGLPTAVAAAPRADDCSVLPRAAMRVRLTLNSPVVADAGPAIREIAGTTWAREGVELRWLDDAPGATPTWAGVDLWVMVRPEAASRQRHDALGAVLFGDGAPHPLIRVSTDAVIAWVHRDVAARFRTVERPFPTLTLGDSRQRVVQALGYVVAHEIGHVVLATRRHAREGLMAAAYERPSVLAAGPMALDATNRRRLAGRLARAAQCPDRPVPSGATRPR